MTSDDKQALLEALAAAKTEIAHLQRDLKATRQAYQSLLDSIGDSILTVDAQTRRIVNANTHALRRLGYAAGDLIGQPLDAVEVPDHEETSLIWESEISGTRFYECHHRHQDGSLLPVEVSSRVVEMNTDKVILLTARSIAKRKQREADNARLRDDLQQSLDMFQIFVHQSNDGIVMVNWDGIIVEWNSAMTGITGVQREEVLDQPILSVAQTVAVSGPTTEHIEGLEVEFRRALSGVDAPWFNMPMEHTILHRDGTPRTILSVVFPIDTGQGRLLGGVLHDITNRKDAQKRAFDLALERERRVILEDFIKSASHEFRTPLATIGTSAYLVTRSTDADKHNRHADLIQAQVQRMSDLLDMLLLMVRLNHVDPDAMKPVDIDALVMSVSHEISDRPVTVTLSPMTPHVRGDAGRLREALAQLLDNAVRHTPRGTAISVTVQHDISVVRVIVHDDGPGISAASLPHIFETFWREDTAHSTPGFGLGLAIVRLIVEQHAGYISVQSMPGTTFTIWLPVTTDKQR